MRTMMPALHQGSSCDPRHAPAKNLAFRDKPMTIENAGVLKCRRDRPTGHRQSQT